MGIVHTAAVSCTRGLAFVGFATILVTGCDNPLDRGSGPLHAPPSFLYDPGTGLDPNINPNDTYVVVDATVQSDLAVTSSTPMLDPNTGGLTNAFTYSSPAESFQLTAGYSYSGLPVATGVFPLDASMELGAGEVQVTRTIGGMSSDYNSSGATLYPAAYETAEGADSLGLALLVSPLLTDALIGGAQPPPSACFVSCGSGVSTRRQLDDSTVVIDRAPESTSTPAMGVTATFRLAPSGRWRVSRLVLRSSQPSAQGLEESITTLSVSVTAEHVNSARDRARQARLTRGDFKLPTASWEQGPPQPRIEQPGTLTSAPDPIPSIGARTCGPQPYAGLHSPIVANGRGLVMAHGFASDACTWYRMEKNRVGTHYAWGQRVVENTSPLLPYDTQRDQLITKMPATTSNYVMIGHSNGGIVSRRVAQLAQTTGVRSVFGVITIGSAHLGAPAAEGGLAAPVVALMTAAAAGKLWLCSRGKRGCGELTAMTDPGGIFRTVESMQNSGTLANEMALSGAFRNSIASVNENFVRSAVVSHAPNRWMFMRFYGDLKCYPDDPTCGGRARVVGTERFYRHLRRTAIISSLSAIAALAFPATSYLAAPLAQTALSAGTMMALMNLVDKTYLTHVVKSNDSDAVVPAFSQFWPNVPMQLQRQVFHADSHVGSTSSPFVANAVDAILQDNLLFGMGYRP